MEAAPASAGDDTVPRLAAGVELLGRYQEGEAEEALYLYRLADGQAVEVTRLIHLVASRLDGHSVGEVARRVTTDVGRPLSPGHVRFLIDQKLRPLGLVAGEDDDGAPAGPVTPLLGLRFRAALVPARVVRLASALCRPLFLPPVVLAVLVAFLAVDLWVFLGHGVSGGVSQVLREPVLVPAVWGLVVLGGLFHELGHATACRYGGGRPGRIGFGLYLVWPVFYSDVTDSYRLGRRGRLRTDLGGVYFNAVFVVLSAAAFAVAGWEFLLVVIVIQHLAMLQQLLPFVRLDGYYVVSDVVGVPDLFPYVKPILKTVLLRRPPHAAVAALGRGARRVVTAWVLLTIPVLVSSLAFLAVHLPDWSATTSESVAVHLQDLRNAIDDGSIAVALGPALEAAALALPLVGLALTLLLSALRAVRGLCRWLRRHPPRHSEPGGPPLVPRPLDHPRKDGRLVDETTNYRPGAGNDNGTLTPRAPGPAGWEPVPGAGDLDLARARLNEQADQLFETLARTIDVARDELRRAEALGAGAEKEAAAVRADAEHEAAAIRAAAKREAAELLARTRSGVHTLLQELAREVDTTRSDARGESSATVPRPPPEANATPPPAQGFASTVEPVPTAPTAPAGPGGATP